MIGSKKTHGEQATSGPSLSFINSSIARPSIFSNAYDLSTTAEVKGLAKGRKRKYEIRLELSFRIFLDIERVDIDTSPLWNSNTSS